MTNLTTEEINNLETLLMKMKASDDFQHEIKDPYRSAGDDALAVLVDEILVTLRAREIERNEAQTDRSDFDEHNVCNKAQMGVS